MMQAIDVSKRTIGLNITEEGKVMANIWSPFAEKVSLVTKDEEIELTKQELGY